MKWTRFPRIFPHFSNLKCGIFLFIFMTYSVLPPTVRVINRVGFSVVYCVFQLYILNLKQSKIQNKLDGWGALLSWRNFVCFQKLFPSWIKGKSLILRSYYTLQQYSTIFAPAENMNIVEYCCRVSFNYKGLIIKWHPTTIFKFLTNIYWNNIQKKIRKQYSKTIWKQYSKKIR